MEKQITEPEAILDQAAELAEAFLDTIAESLDEGELARVFIEPLDSLGPRNHVARICVLNDTEDPEAYYAAGDERQWMDLDSFVNQLANKLEDSNPWRITASFAQEPEDPATLNEGLDPASLEETGGWAWIIGAGEIIPDKRPNPVHYPEAGPGPEWTLSTGFVFEEDGEDEEEEDESVGGIDSLIQSLIPDSSDFNTHTAVENVGRLFGDLVLNNIPAGHHRFSLNAVGEPNQIIAQVDAVSDGQAPSYGTGFHAFIEKILTEVIEVRQAEVTLISRLEAAEGVASTYEVRQWQITENNLFGAPAEETRNVFLSKSPGMVRDPSFHFVDAWD